MRRTKRSPDIQKKLLAVPITTYVAVIMIIFSLLFESAGRMHMLIAASVIAGYDVIYMSAMAIIKGRLLSTDLFTLAAIIGTFALGKSYEAALSMIVYSVCRNINKNAAEFEKAKHEYIYENIFSDEDRKWFDSMDKHPARIERKVRKWSGTYTLVSLAAIIVLTVIVPLVWRQQLNVWLSRAFVLLAISNGWAAELCASVEFARVKEVGAGERILFKSNQAIEDMSHITSVVFSRSDSMSEDYYEITDVIPRGVSRDTLLTAAAYACMFSSAPEAYFVVQNAGVRVDRSEVERYKYLLGLGSVIIMKGIRITAGSSELMHRMNIQYAPEDNGGCYIHVCIENKYAGCIKMAKKTGAAGPEAVHALHKAGIDRVILITNENSRKAAADAERIGFDEVWSEIGEEKSLKKLQNLRDMQIEGERLAYIGGGKESHNMLIAADVGIEICPCPANSVGDVVVSDGNYLKVSNALKLSKRLMHNIYRKLSHVAILKIVSVILAFCGLSGVWFASIIDSFAVTDVIKGTDEK